MGEMDSLGDLFPGSLAKCYHRCGRPSYHCQQEGDLGHEAVLHPQVQVARQADHPVGASRRGRGHGRAGGDIRAAAPTLRGESRCVREVGRCPPCGGRLRRRIGPNHTRPSRAGQSAPPLATRHSTCIPTRHLDSEPSGPSSARNPKIVSCTPSSDLTHLGA